MAGSQKAATPNSTSGAAAATAAAFVALLLVLVCCGTSGSGSGSGGRAFPHLPPRWRYGGVSDGDGDVSLTARQQRHPQQTDKDKLRSSASAPATGAAAAAASVAAVRAWTSRDDEEGLVTLLEGAATKSTDSKDTPSSRTERTRRKRGLHGGSGQGSSPVLFGAPPANDSSHLPHDAVAKEADAGWARRNEENGEHRRREKEVDGGGLGGEGEFRLRGDRRRQWRHQWLSAAGEEKEERADDEQEGARGAAAEEAGARYEGSSGGGLEGRRGRSLHDFKHPRCFVAEGEERTRCHANIFFFGVSKCGTTSLAHWMAEHPEVCIRRWSSC